MDCPFSKRYCFMTPRLLISYQFCSQQMKHDLKCNTYVQIFPVLFKSLFKFCTPHCDCVRHIKSIFKMRRATSSFLKVNAKEPIEGRRRTLCSKNNKNFGMPDFGHRGHEVSQMPHDLSLSMFRSAKTTQNRRRGATSETCLRHDCRLKIGLHQ